MSKTPRAGVMSKAALQDCRESTPACSHPRIGLDLIRSIQRHSGWVYSVAVSPDDSLIASCSNDRTARIFKASDVAAKSDSSCGVVLSGHSHAIRCCAFNTSGSLLATASWDGDVRIWDVVTGACVRVLAAAAGGNRVYACAWTAPAADACETVAAAGGGGGACPVDFAVRLWKLEADGAVSCRVFEGHMKAVTCIAFDADGRSLVSSSDDHTLRVWDVASGSCCLVMAHQNAVCCCCWGPGHNSCPRTIASGDQDSIIIVWNAITGAPLFRIGSRQTAVLSLVYISLGTMLASGGRDGSIKIWDAACGAGVALLRAAHSDSVRAMVCDSTGRLLVSGSADTSVKLWQQDDHPPPLPSSALMLRQKHDKADGAKAPSCEDSSSVLVAALCNNHGLLLARSKQSLAASFDTPTDVDDDTELAAAAAFAESSSSSESQRICCECGDKWSFEAKEREHFAAKGYHEPRRCGKCRRLQRQSVRETLLSSASTEAGRNCTAFGGRINGIASTFEAAPESAVASRRHHVYRGTNSKGIGFIYEGEVSASGRHEGFGSQTWDSKHSYKGEWLGGRKEGRGVYTWPNGSTFVGEYKNGRRHGSGVQTMSDGAVYDGSFVNGKWEGAGQHTWRDTFTLGNGRVVRGYMQYTGEYSGGVMHGHGQICWPDGSIYDGLWRNGSRHGLGEMMLPNGRRQHGIWQEDVLTQVLVRVANGKMLPVSTRMSSIGK